jgi:hypothetical protein
MQSITPSEYATQLQSIAVHLTAIEAEIASLGKFAAEVLEALGVEGAVDANGRRAALEQLDLVIEEARRWATSSADTPAGQIAAKLASAEHERDEALDWVGDLLHALGVEGGPSAGSVAAADLAVAHLRREIHALTTSLERERAEAEIRAKAGRPPARDPIEDQPPIASMTAEARIQSHADLRTMIRGIVFEEVEAALARNGEALNLFSRRALRHGADLDAEAEEFGLCRIVFEDGRVEDDFALRGRILRKLARSSGGNN